MLSHHASSAASLLIATSAPRYSKHDVRALLYLSIYFNDIVLHFSLASQEGVLFGCADGYVTLVTVAAAEGPGDVLPGTPVQLPFVLAPETEAELLQAQVRHQGQVGQVQTECL